MISQVDIIFWQINILYEKAAEWSYVVSLENYVDFSGNHFHSSVTNVDLPDHYIEFSNHYVYFSENYAERTMTQIEHCMLKFSNSTNIIIWKVLAETCHHKPMVFWFFCFKHIFYRVLDWVNLCFLHHLQYRSIIIASINYV